MSKDYKYAVVYRDDGPKGMCGQSMSITREWTSVYLFKTEEEALEWLGDNPVRQERQDRKNPRCVICGEGYDDSLKIF